MTTSRIARIGLNCSVLSFATACIFYVYTYFMQPTHCFIKHDWRAHNSLKRKVHTLVHELLQSPACSLDFLLQEIKKQIPDITFNSHELKPIKKALCGYQVPTALALIKHANKLHILTPQGLLNAQLYSTSYIKQLMVIESHELVTKPLQKFLENTPFEILENYSITWNNKTEIWLQPKSSGLPLLVGADTQWTPERIQAVRNFSAYILSKKPKNKNLLIDLRINNYILLKTRSDA